MSDHDEFGAFLVGFIFGGLTGAVAALLLAPQSGEETRAVIKERSIELADRATVEAEEAWKRAETTAQNARTKADELAQQARMRGEEINLKARKQGEELYDAAVEKVKKVTSRVRKSEIETPGEETEE